MEILLKKAKVNSEELISLVTRVVAEELSRLSEPCYQPVLKKYQYEILRFTNLTDQDIKDFVKRFYSSTKVAHLNLVKDSYSNLLFFVMYYFLYKKNNKAFVYSMLFYNIRTYANLMYRQFPSHCNPEAFKYALEHLGKNHLYSVHKTIGNSIAYLSSEMVKKYQKGIMSNDPMTIVKFIQECRHRLSQSIRSFAEIYYEAIKGEKFFKSPYETEEGIETQEGPKISKIINDTIRKIIIHQFIDKKSLDDSKTLTKVSSMFADDIVKQVSNLKYEEDVRIILDLYLKNITNVNELCGKQFFITVQKLMATKRSNAPIYFKQQIENLLDKILISTNLKKKFELQTNQTRYLNKLFLAFYLTISMRNIIC